MTRGGSEDRTSTGVRAFAPAKVNLTLDVSGRRDDGYHEISTWMLAVDLCDEVWVRVDARAGVRLDVDGPQRSPDIPVDEKNLAWRAASAFLRAAHAHGRLARDTGLSIALTKRIPSQAGLGGASSDAAAVWIAAQSALDIVLPFEVASNELAALGSDCAFFWRASSGLARCTGRGECVGPSATIPSAWSVAILTPAVLCPTASVYRAVTKHLSERTRLPTVPGHWSDVAPEAARTLFFNRLEDAALEAIPDLRPWRSTLDACGAAHFRLSGSGSSFFGVFDDRVEASTTLERILGEARERGLAVRGHWVARPFGRAATLAR